MEYEICYLIGESKEAETEKIKKDIEKTVTSKGGSFSGIEFVDKRKMAYAIKKEIRGTYFARRFELSGEGVKGESEDILKKSPLASITEKLNLNQDILRFTIVKVDTLPSLKTRGDMEKETERVRISELERKNAGRVRREKAAPQKSPVAKKEKEKKAESQSDIDKKLDEILNI